MSLYWFLWQPSSKRTKKLQFCSILLYKNKLPDVREIEIWNVRSLPPLVCPCKYSCQCPDFCRSHAQKKYKKSLSCSILQYKNILPDNPETWNLTCRFFIPVSLSMYNFISLYWFLWQSSSKRYKKLQFCSILQYKNRLPDVWETWNLECTFLIPVTLSL